MTERLTLEQALDFKKREVLGNLLPEVVQATNAAWWEVVSKLNPASVIYAPNIKHLRDGKYAKAMVPNDFDHMMNVPEFSHGNVLWLGAGIGVDGAIPLAGWKHENGKGGVVAVDVSHEATKFAAELVHKLDISNMELSAVAAGIYNLPFRDGPFDAVAMTGGVLQYLPSLGEVACQVYSVLNRGGVLYWRDNGPVVPGEPITLVDEPPIIGTGYYGLSPAHESDPEAHRLLEELAQLPVIRFRYSPATIQGALRDAGFDDVRVETQDYLGYQRDGMYLDKEAGVYRYPSDSPSAGKPLSFVMTARKYV